MTRSLGRIVMFLIAALALVLAAACSRSGAGTSRYHCPMHPTYVSDKPGDCPICGMRLVPIDEGKTSASPAKRAAPSSSATVWSCPMHPDVVSDRPGRCPKCGMALEPHAPAGASGEHKILFYRSPMDPKVTSPVPAKDSMGMDFVPVYADEQAASGPVPGLAPIDVDPEGLQLAGVRTAVAERGKLERTIRAVGIVRPDETRVRHVHTKISGWIDKLIVNFTGESVKKGSPILSLYSQELLATQEEYLRARDAATSLEKSGLSAAKEQASSMLESARRRLELFDVPTGLITELDKTGVPRRTVTLLAPASGIVTGKQIFEGQQVEPGMELFTISDLSRVWIEADLYENEANSVHVGDKAKISLAYGQQPDMNGSVKYVYPFLNPETRTLRIRFEFPNPDLALKLEAFVNVEIPVAASEGVIVPDSAIMDTGLRQIVFVNTSGGHFEPRQIRVGIRADGKAQILSGVQAGEHVAVKANFLLDSESRLRAAISAPSDSAPTTSAQANP